MFQWYAYAFLQQSHDVVKSDVFEAGDIASDSQTNELFLRSTEKNEVPTTQKELLVASFEVDADKLLDVLPYKRNVLEKIKTETKALHNKNKDVIGYMYLEEYLNEPIVYTPEDMEYYLHRNLEKEEEFSGTPFMSSYGSGDFRFNALIYGHYMMDGTKFGSLMSLIEQEQFEGAKELLVYDLVADQFIVYELTHTFNLTDGEEFIVLDKFDSLLQMQNYNYKWYQDSFLKVERPFESFSSHHLYLQTCEAAYGRERQVFAFQEIDRGR